MYGSCYCSPDKSTMYVNIPKNASTWANANFRSLGWRESNFLAENLDYSTAIVALRDPVDRWCSGITEYLYLNHPTFTSYDYTQAIFDLIFGKVNFDDHTECQVKFLNGLDYNRCVFFWVDDNYSFRLSSHLKNNNIKITKSYTSDQKLFKQTTKKIFKDQLTNSKYLNQIKKYFKEDYTLIESVKFYEPR